MEPKTEEEHYFVPSTKDPGLCEECGRDLTASVHIQG
jgi:hypothetical protein